MTSLNLMSPLPWFWPQLAIIYHEKWKGCPCLQISEPIPTIIPTVSDLGFIYPLILSSNIILLGNFSIQMNNINYSFTMSFVSCLESIGIQEHIHFHTHFGFSLVSFLLVVQLMNCL